MTRLLLSACLMFYGIAGLAQPLAAAQGNDDLQAKRRILAESFVARLKNRLTPVSTAESAGGLTQSAQDLSRIAPGMAMQFRPRVGKIRLDFDIYALKAEGDDFYLSLRDLIAALDLPITLDDSAGTAAGWFLREDWRFDMDIPAAQVTARGQDYTLGPGDYMIDGGEVFIAGKSAEQWFGMKYAYNTSEQYVDIDSAWPLPVVAKIKRRDRQGAGSTQSPVAQLPLKEYGYDWANLTAADLSWRSQYARRGASDVTSFVNRADARITGDFLKHDAYLFLTGDDTNRLNAAQVQLSRKSATPDLLGPLGARSYALGDVQILDTPLIGDGVQELGVRVSNAPLISSGYQTTRITGFALPGWDVELYREGTLIDSLVVDDTGRYEFADIQLFAGDNLFDVLFYGAQGEVRIESVSLPLNDAVLRAQEDTYDLSISLRESQTYARISSEDVDADTLHVAGQYNFRVGDALSYVAVRTAQENEVRRYYLGSGMTTTWAGTLVDASVAVDDQSEMAFRVGLRRNIAGWRAAITAQAQTDSFMTEKTALPPTFQAQANVNRRFYSPIGTSANFSAGAGYRQFSDGSEARDASVSISQGFRRFSLSDSLRYNETIPVTGESAQRVFNDISLRASLTSRLVARASASYMIRPESRMDRYSANLNYRPGPRLNFDAKIDHAPEREYTLGELKANYTHDRFRFSPFIRYDNNDDLTAGMNLSTSLIDRPETAFPLVTGNRVSGQGMVSARVFLDRNGNRIFDEGDEPMPEVVVESVNSRRKATTANSGYALLDRLSTAITTDIQVDYNSLPDPFMVSVNRGNAVLPRPGKIYEMDFPIQFSGEVDGTVSVIRPGGGDKLASYVTVVLIPIDPAGQEVVARAGSDGFFVLDRVPPGQYLMTVKAEDARTVGAAQPVPELMTFGHEGDVVTAHDIRMTGGHHDIDFTLYRPADFKEWTAPGATVFVNLPGAQEGRSLLNVLHRLRMRDVASRVVAGLPQATLTMADERVLTRYHVPSGSLEEAWQRCGLLSAQKLPCGVDVVIAPVPVPVSQTQPVPSPAPVAETAFTTVLDPASAY